MKSIQRRTAKDPERFVADLNGATWGRGTLKVRLVSIDGETASGRKRFTIEIEEVPA